MIGMESFGLGYAHRHDESLRVAGEALAADPDSFFVRWNELRALGWMGDHARAIAVSPALLSASGRSTWVLGALAYSYGKLGDVKRARALSDELEARSRTEYVASSWRAVAADAAGLRDEGMRLVEESRVAGDPMFVLARIMPYFDGMIADPRWPALSR
ncbi:MAG: hypothetical protein IPJ04_14560 [Candidatus Eisenbacteria bacterium]|nr:hypothetical protein [Candidatus Eisenbacteria bacterium]